MDYCANETLGHREEGRHIKESIVATKDVPFLKITGEECQEGKEEEDDHNITLPMPRCP